MPGDMLREIWSGLKRFWGLSWWWKGPILSAVTFFSLGVGLAASGVGDGEGSHVLDATPTPTEAPTAAPTPTPAPTPSPSPEPTSTPVPEPTATPTPEPTSRPTPTPLPPTPAPTVAPPPPCETSAPSNPYGYDFCSSGNFIYDPPADICTYIACIGNFWNGVGYVIQCKDGMFSKSGGRSGSCSHHGGNLRPLYSH